MEVNIKCEQSVKRIQLINKRKQIWSGLSIDFIDDSQYMINNYYKVLNNAEAYQTMEAQKLKPIQPSDHCHNCDKNQQLIHKYEKLIKLFRKREEKTNSMLSSKLSVIKTTSHTSEAQSSTMNSCKMFYALQSILLKRYCSFFCLSHKKTTKKFLLLSLANRLSKTLQRQALNKIKLSSKQHNLDILKSLNQRINCSVIYGFYQIKKCAKLKSKYNQMFAQSAERNSSNLTKKGFILELNPSLQKNRINNVKQLARKNTQLELTNYKLRKENIQLKQMLQQSIRRQNKQSQKKRQSLQMLAEELCEKNQYIKELTGTIKTYQNKYELINNVLDDDIVSLRKEVDHLELVRDKLQHQMTKLTKRFEVSQNSEKSLQSSADLLQKQNKILKQKLFDLEAKDIYTKQLTDTQNALISKLQSQNKKLSQYERQIIELKRGSQKQFILESSSIINETKTQIILCFLQNINIPDYQIPSLQLFDEEEQQVLIKHQIAYNRTAQEMNMFSNINTSNKKNNDDEIQYRGRNVEVSIFGCMDSPRQSNEKTKNMRLLEMELEKNKQIEKISELKEKTMHIRVIVLNLLKSLQNKNFSSESNSILQILFDMFEYSEQEREEALAVKKKKFFGFI